MTAKTTRIQVTLKPEVLEKIKFLSKKKNIAPSVFVRQIVLDWLRDYGDFILMNKS